MGAEFDRGSTSMREYTPGADVIAGAVITISGQQYIAHRDIAATELGALACPYGGGAYKVPTNGAQVIADGAPVLINAATGEIDGTGVHLGYAEGAVANGDAFAIVRHDSYVGVIAP